MVRKTLEAEVASKDRQHGTRHLRVLGGGKNPGRFIFKKDFRMMFLVNGVEKGDFPAVTFCNTKRLEVNKIPLISGHLPSLTLTVRTWKWMVRILVSFWGPAYLQGQTVSLRECNHPLKRSRTEEPGWSLFCWLSDSPPSGPRRVNTQHNSMAVR